ncbi:MAG: tetratricopeptide repeat protein [Planctomycetota bacterium]
MAESAREQEIFHEALERPEAEWEEFVRDRAGQDPSLARRVLGLLKGHRRAVEADAEDLVEQVGRAAAAAPAAAPAVPDHIGPYRVLGRLGEGGMGVVYAAEQAEPVRRRVAVKVVRSGVDSAEILARFDAERQALALMSHPNIAQILDAGVHDRRPYFVMERIAGLPITEYCDRVQMPVAGRLELFVAVCGGVQHAHQKGVIHRDLKPSNVLVGDDGGEPIPKIIDFGIAKAVTPSVFEVDVHTELGRIVGTPDYMSPEQCETTALDVDTRADVYSLGALLYELLTGATVFGLFDGSIGFDEMRSTIRDREPLRPSARLAQAPLRAQEAAGSRSARPDDLARHLRADLDWITLKALAKDRGRRYQTASELAADVSRYLRGEPVVARPPSRVYRISKFVRRNRAATSSALVASMALVAATVVSASFAVSEREQQLRTLAANAALEEQRGRAQAMVDFLTQDLLTSASPSAGPGLGRDVTMREALDVAAQSLDARSAAGGVFADRPAVVAQLRAAIGETYADLGAYEGAERELTEALRTARAHLDRLDPTVLGAVLELGTVHRALSNDELAELYYREAITLWEEAFGDGPEVLVPLGNYGVFLDSVGRTSEALAIYERVFQERRRTEGESNVDTIMAAANLVSILERVGEGERAREIAAQFLDVARTHHGDDAAITLSMLQSRVLSLAGADLRGEALPLCEELVDRSRRVFGPEHDQTAYALNTYGNLLRDRGDLDGALAAFEEAVEAYESTLGLEHRERYLVHANLADVLVRMGRFGEAAEILESVCELVDDKEPEGRPERGIVHGLFSDALSGLDLHEDAAREAVLAYGILSDAESVRPGDLTRAAQRAARAYARWNHAAPTPDRAELAKEWADIAAASGQGG